MLDNLDETISATIIGIPNEGIIEDFKEARETWERHGGPEMESYLVPGLSGGPLRLKGGGWSEYEYALVNEDVWVGIGMPLFSLYLEIQCRDQALHRYGLDDLENAGNAIADYFLQQVLFMEHPYEVVLKRFGLKEDDQGPEDLERTFPDREDSLLEQWKREEATWWMS